MKAVEVRVVDQEVDGIASLRAVGAGLCLRLRRRFEAAEVLEDVGAHLLQPGDQLVAVGEGPFHLVHQAADGVLRYLPVHLGDLLGEPQLLLRGIAAQIAQFLTDRPGGLFQVLPARLGDGVRGEGLAVRSHRHDGEAARSLLDVEPL
jgi:hypothetical protein